VNTLLALAAIALGFVVLEVAAERFTGSIGALSGHLGASEGTVGLLTAGGEWEELVVVLAAVLSGNPGLALGNVVGACLANLIGSLPLGLLTRRPLVPDRSARIYGLVMVAVTALVLLLAFEGHVTRADGGVLVALFVFYVASVVLVIRRGWLPPPVRDDDEAPHDLSLRRDIVTLVVSFALISLAAEAIVLGSVHVAHVLGLSQFAIGVTVVALGTTLPDKAISFIGALRGQSGVVTSNAVGSNIFLLTLVLGLAAVGSGSGVAVSRSVTHVDLPLLLAASVLVVALFRRPSLHWRTGGALLALYAGYLAFALLRG
jgi:cation:H+ antiporter